MAFVLGNYYLHNQVSNMLGIPKCYKLSPMSGFIYHLYQIEEAWMTLAIVIYYFICVVSYFVKSKGWFFELFSALT